MANEIKGLYEFGPYRLDAAKRLLVRAGEVVPLKPKAFDLLLLLVESGGRVLGKAELMRSLWPGTVVEEANLSFQVFAVRKALGEDGARWIETVPKHGYRFSARVEQVQRDGPASLPPYARSSRRRRSVVGALLPIVLVAVVIWNVRGRGNSTPQQITAFPLTSYPGSEEQASLSPDGNQVAFAWDGEQQENWDIYARAVGPDDAPLRLTRHPAEDRFPAWSPEGDQIAFVRQGAIFVVPVLGGVERKLGDVESSGPISWSPDGNWIAASRPATVKRAGNIVLVPVQGGDQRTLTTFDSNQSHENPVVSHDGRWLAFLSCYGKYASCDVYVLELSRDLMAAGEARRVTREQACVLCGLTWSPDGQSLLYGVRMGRPGLWRASISGMGSPRQIGFGPDINCWPGVSARRNRLVYSQKISNRDIMVFERGSPLRKFIASTRDEASPEFSPDGKRLAFASNRSGGIEVWLANQDGSQPVRLTTSRYSASARWSPDGQWIAYDSQAEDGNWDVFVVEQSGGPARRLVGHPANDSVPSWSRDGKSIYFTSNRNGGRNQIFRVPVSGGEALQVTDSGGVVAVESVDGRTLFYTKTLGGSSPLFARSVAGGPERQVIDSVYNRSFAVTRAGLYYVAETGSAGVFALSLVDFASGKSEVLTKFEGTWAKGVTVSADGKRVLFGLETQSTADLMLVENFQ